MHGENELRLWTVSEELIELFQDFPVARIFAFANRVAKARATATLLIKYGCRVDHVTVNER